MAGGADDGGGAGQQLRDPDLCAHLSSQCQAPGGGWDGGLSVRADPGLFLRDRRRRVSGRQGRAQGAPPAVPVRLRHPDASGHVGPRFKPDHPADRLRAGVRQSDDARADGDDHDGVIPGRDPWRRAGIRLQCRAGDRGHRTGAGGAPERPYRLRRRHRHPRFSRVYADADRPHAPAGNAGKAGDRPRGGRAASSRRHPTRRCRR